MSNIVIKIKMQSFSDIITNSSSELFCKIKGKNLEEILNLIDPLFDYEYDYESRAYIEEEEPEYVKCYLSYTANPKVHTIAINAILKEILGEGNYEIEFFD